MKNGPRGVWHAPSYTVNTPWQPLLHHVPKKRGAVTCCSPFRDVFGHETVEITCSNSSVVNKLFAVVNGEDLLYTTWQEIKIKSTLRF